MIRLWRQTLSLLTLWWRTPQERWSSWLVPLVIMSNISVILDPSASKTQCCTRPESFSKFKCTHMIAKKLIWTDECVFISDVMLVRLQMENKGSIKLEYSWQVLMETYGKTTCFENRGKTSALKMFALWCDACCYTLLNLMFLHIHLMQGGKNLY